MSYTTFIELSDTFLTIFFTALLTFFSFVQWKAVEEQNKQNLFKIRVEHYSKFNAILIDIHVIAMRLLDRQLHNDIAEYKAKIYQLEKITLETEYLFNKDVFSLETKTIVEYAKLLDKIEQIQNQDRELFQKTLHSVSRELGITYKNATISFLSFK